jgi:hypothetical protein
MKKCIFLIIIIVFGIHSLQAQHDCDCNEALEKLVTLIERDYPGLEEKTRDKHIYSSFKKELISKADTTGKEECLPILKSYISFFRDGHIAFLSNQSSIKVEKTFVKTTLPSFRKTIAKTTDTLEGIWVNDQMKIGIIKQDNIYKGFMIAAANSDRKQHEVIFTLDKREHFQYIFSNQTTFDGAYSVIKDTLLLNRLGYGFIKDNQEVLDTNFLKVKTWELEGFYIKKLTPRTAIFKIKSFNYPYIRRIDELVSLNRDLIENIENLIIDITDNGGGTDITYGPLLPYILTNNTRHTGNEFYSTEFLIKGLQDYVAKLDNNETNQKDIQRINNNINYLKQHLREFVVYPDEQRLMITERKLAVKSPKQILILTNKRSASSAESFLLTVRQSKKVKVMGIPTFGALDYASARITDYNCLGLSMILPTYRSTRLPDFPIDNIGVQPDIYVDQTQDLLSVALEYLEQ